MSEELTKFLTAGGANVVCCESENAKIAEAERMLNYFKEHRILDIAEANMAIARAKEILAKVPG
jgi:hypothetical protein